MAEMDNCIGNTGLQDRVVIVTGAGKGIGRAACLHLARRGAKVLVNNRRHPGELDARQFILLEFPHDFAFGIHLENAVSVSRADQGVSIGDADHAEKMVPERLGPVPSSGLLSKKGHLKLPDHLAVPRVFTHLPVVLAVQYLLNRRINFPMI